MLQVIAGGLTEERRGTGGRALSALGLLDAEASPKATTETPARGLAAKTKSRRTPWIDELLAAVPPGSRIRGAYDLFILEREGRDLSDDTMAWYENMLGEFVGWVGATHPELRSPEDIQKEHVSAYRVYLKGRPVRHPGARGETLSKEALLGSQRAVRTFFGWALEDGYAIDERILGLKKTKLPKKEADVFHISQIRGMLGACATETERVALRIFTGTGARLSEVGGISTRADDGLPDLMTDSMDRGHADVRLRWTTTKGEKTRRVRVCPTLVMAMRKYELRYRPESTSPLLLISERTHQPLRSRGFDTLMGRLQQRVGYRVHAHAFRHTFATVAVQMGWNLERLRAAMGHEDYDCLLRYVKLATVRDLGDLNDWKEFIAAPITVAA